jgi:hypothetical protein
MMDFPVNIKSFSRVRRGGYTASCTDSVKGYNESVLDGASEVA